MQIMKVLDKKKSGEYMRYRINLPKEAVEDSNLLGKDLKIYWNGVDKLIIEVNDDKD